MSLTGMTPHDTPIRPAAGSRRSVPIAKLSHANAPGDSIGTRATTLLAAGSGRGRVRHQPAVAALAALLLLAGCSGRATKETAAPAPVRMVSVERVGNSLSGAGLVLPARVKAREEATLGARIAGRVTALPVREGARVRTGEVLAVFDAPEARQMLDAARSDLAAAELALGVAKRQHERMESLRAAAVVPERDRELAESEHRAAAARLAAARARFDAAQAATRVRAPFAGVVVRRHLDVGADVGAGTPIVDLRSEGAVEIVVPVPEAAVAGLAHGALAAQADDGPWRPVRLARLDGMTDFVSRTRTAHLSFADRGAALEPGTYARVRIAPAPGAAPAASDPRASLSVPVASVVRRGGLAGVFVVDGERAVLRWLKLGRIAGDRAEVLGGLAAGDAVVLAPQGLADGAAVRVKS